MTKQAALPQKAGGPATRAGFSILDMMLALGIFTILLATFGGTVTSMVRSPSSIEVRTSPVLRVSVRRHSSMISIRAVMRVSSHTGLPFTGPWMPPRRLRPC